MALDKDERVYTKSIGTGANRKLMILRSKMKTTETNQANPKPLDRTIAALATGQAGAAISLIRVSARCLLHRLPLYLLATF